MVCINLLFLDYLNPKELMFEWSKACKRGFQELKDKLTSALMLTLSEGTQGLVVCCDACRVGLGCAPMQHGKVIAYASG